MQTKIQFNHQIISQVIQSQHWSLSNEGDDVVKDFDDINQSLENLWNTEVGSDILRPDYGCDWQQYIDYPIDEAPLLIIRTIMIATQKWEPRVVILGITYHVEISQIYFRTRYKLNDAIANDLKNIEHQTIIRGLL